MQPDIKLPRRPGLRTYRGLLNQSDTDNPIAIELKNTLTNGTNEWNPGQYPIVWTRTGQGEYKGELNDIFEITKTFITISNPSNSTIETNLDITPGTILLKTFNSIGTQDDGILNYTGITIEIYW